MWSVVLFVVISSVCTYVIHKLFKAMISKKRNDIVLPPGSMGLPFIGETLSVLVQNPSIDLHPFFKKRFQRYGLLFKTRIATRPVVVSADPKLNHFLLKEEGNLVEFWYLDSFSKLFNHEGETRANAVGRVHRYLRSLTLNYFGVESIKETLISQFEQAISKTLTTWSNKDTFEVQHSLQQMIFDIIAEQMLGEKLPKILSDKVTNYLEIMLSLPINIPGTKFHMVMKLRTKIMDIVRDKLRERVVSSKPVVDGDILDQTIEDMKTEKFIMDEDFIIQYFFSILFTTFESISSNLTLAIQLLGQNSSAREQLKAEHEDIIMKRTTPNSCLSWDEYKSMTFTHQVINESLRLANGSPGILRRVLQDIKVDGYTIPKGWTIMIASSAQHLDPTIYANPLEFNPWRWTDLDSYAISKVFMPFGGGIRFCPGSDYGKSFMSTFFHVLVTKFRWELVRGSDISRNPFLNFRGGVHIKVSNKE